MGTNDGSYFVLKQGNGSPMSFQSSHMDSAQQSDKVEGAAVSSRSICKEVSSVAVPLSYANTEQFLVGHWDPSLSVDQDVNFNVSAGFSPYNAGDPESHWINSSTTAGMEKLLRLASTGQQNFSELMGSFTLPGSNHIAGDLCSPEFPATDEQDIVKSLKGKKRKRIPECVSVHPHPPLTMIQNIEAEQQEDTSPETIKNPIAKDEKQKNDLNPSVGSRKPALAHAKENSQNAATEEDYNHIRAKRGQATSSHSLAERLRREKISERMKLLQDIVPGCNKITGKAAMLDEIINYVQLLQRQVEFLSMKLAAVNIDLNADTEQILSQYNLGSQYGGSVTLGYGPRISSSHPQFHGSSMQAEMIISNISSSRGMPITTAPSVTPSAQISSVWDNELQGDVQMGFISDQPLGSMELNHPLGSMELNHKNT